MVPVLLLLLGWAVQHSQQYGPCPNVTVSAGLFLTGYHTENVLKADSKCTVHCDNGLLWCGPSMTSLLQFPPLNIVGKSSSGQYEYGLGNNQTCTVITCARPPLKLGSDCDKSMYTSTCDPNLICDKDGSHPVVTTSGGFSNVTCPNGQRLFSSSFEQFRLNKGGMACGADKQWYGSTGWLVNKTVACAFDVCSNSCLKLTLSDECLAGHQCDKAKIKTTTGQKLANGESCMTATCTEGVLYVTNDPAGTYTVDIAGKSDVLYCGKTTMTWYRNGVKSGGAPKVTCVIKQMENKGCPALNISICSNDHSFDQICSQGGQSMGTDTSMQCAQGLTFVGAGVEGTKVSSLKCSLSDGVWKTDSGKALKDPKAPLTCALDVCGSTCKKQVVTDECPSGYTCNSKQLAIGSKGSCNTITCTEGVLYVDNDPPKTVNLHAESDMLICGANTATWYRNGTKSASFPQVTCVMETQVANVCKNLTFVACDATKLICSNTSKVIQTASSVRCSEGSRLAGDGVRVAKLETLKCSKKSWLTPLNLPIMDDSKPITCATDYCSDTCNYTTIDACSPAFECSKDKVRKNDNPGIGGFACRTLSCSEGILVVAGSSISILSQLPKNGTLRCDTLGNFYLFDGTNMGPDVKVTCVLRQKRSCPALPKNPCDSSRYICTNDTINSDGSSASCSSGSSLLGPGLGRQPISSLACSVSTGRWIPSVGNATVNPNQLFCGVNYCSDTCSPHTISKSCPQGFACDSSLLQLSVSQVEGATCRTVRCSRGTLYSSNPEVKFSGMQCAGSQMWYTTDGMPVSRTPSVTCITGEKKDCPAVTLSSCDNSVLICGDVGFELGQVNSSSVVCPTGSKLLGSSLTGLFYNGLVCNKNGQWASISGITADDPMNTLYCGMDYCSSGCVTYTASTCPKGYTCDSAQLRFNNGDKFGIYKCQSITCATGHLFVQGDSAPDIIAAGISDILQCSTNKLWYRRAGTALMLSIPSITCIVGSPGVAKQAFIQNSQQSCQNPKISACNTKYQICTISQQQTTPRLQGKTIACINGGTLAGSPELASLAKKAASLTCGSDGTWKTPSGESIKITVNTILSCALQDGSNKCPAAVPARTCPETFVCSTNALKISTTNGINGPVSTVSCSQGKLMIVNDQNWPLTTILNTASAVLMCATSGTWSTTSGVASVSSPQATCVLEQQDLPNCQKCVHPSTKWAQKGLPAQFPPTTPQYRLADPSIVNGCKRITNMCRKDTLVMSAYLPDGSNTLLPAKQMEQSFYLDCVYPYWSMRFAGTAWSINVDSAECVDLAATMCKSIPVISENYVRVYNNLVAPIAPINLPVGSGTSVNGSAICQPGYSLAVDLQYPVRNVLVTRSSDLSQLHIYCMYDQWIFDNGGQCNPIRAAGCIKCTDQCWSG